jgi:hypothetical protein
MWAAWRWVFLVNVPIAATAAIAAPHIVRETRGNLRGIDIPGAVTITLAFTALV